MYKYIKSGLDRVLALIGLILLAPLFLILIIAIKLDSRGPVLFRQKRVGIHKSYFEILKFRTMRVDTPKDVPTHMLADPEQYITKVGKFLRKTSLDELPQILNIWKGDMAIVGPRPALWNQYDLIAERDKYGANDVLPGLTGWAQINGRDELSIQDKARLDGEYVARAGFLMDVKCFLATIGSVLKSDGVVEGGTGELMRRQFHEDTGLSGAGKKVLITGAGSYVGEAVEHRLLRAGYKVDTLDMRPETWKDFDFRGYDAVFHVAGIAHADVGKVTEEQKKLYYEVNTKLAVETARKAKRAGVGQFLFMSSMIIYGGCGQTRITRDTKPKALNFYGNSKLQADLCIQKLSDDTFRTVVLRCPMIYGKGSKGNYRTLRKLALKLPVFPKVKNKRSMLYIENLCEFVKCMIDRRESGVFFPQNEEYMNTSELVAEIARVRGHRILMLPGMNLPVKLLGRMPGKVGKLAEKAFGDMLYDMDMSHYDVDYRVCSWQESVKRTEA